MPPIWLELIVLTLLSYGSGAGTGWFLARAIRRRRVRRGEKPGGAVGPNKERAV